VATRLPTVSIGARRRAVVQVDFLQWRAGEQLSDECEVGINNTRGDGEPWRETERERERDRDLYENPKVAAVRCTSIICVPYDVVCGVASPTEAERVGDFRTQARSSCRMESVYLVCRRKVVLAGGTLSES
jgi:hypothetical protein